ncbi:MAG: C45 family peptidase [Chthoniobacteraceae bacterium]
MKTERPASSMGISRRALLLLCCGLATVVFGGAQVASLTPGQRLFARTLAELASVLDSDPQKSRALSTTLELLRADGVPGELRGMKLDLQVAAPDRIRISTTIRGEHIELGRDRQELWVWQPSKNFGVIGSPGVPKYAGNPASIDTTKLGALAPPPFLIALVALLPRLSTVEQLADEEIEGTPCHVIRAEPLPSAKAALGIGRMTITIHARSADSFPMRIGVEDGKQLNVAVAVHSPRRDVALSEDNWRPGTGAEAKIERVALAHLSRFIDAGLGMLNKPSPQAPGPADGKRRLVASSGAGRLEIHDGTRVLFLKGTPEETGRQHGELLGREIRDVVQRVLYGVGVGSSFEKGEWFFGTIERCQTRIGKFVDPRHLREMDAIAAAAGCDAEEIRLANFFPELFHCSGFALMGDSTKDGHIYHGRILDYMRGVGLEQNAVVIVTQPDTGHAWANVSYAGFTGSVTAMNDAKISIGEMGGRGEGSWDGKPMAQLVREVMEKAGTLDEAIEIMRRSPRTCEYYYVIADGKTKRAVGIKATPEIFEVVNPGEAHPQLDAPVKDTVLLSAGDRYVELVKRVKSGYGSFDASSSRDLMTRPVCMTSNIHSVLFAPDTLDFWVANADGTNPASHTRYTHYNLAELIASKPALP